MLLLHLLTLNKITKAFRRAFLSHWRLCHSGEVPDGRRKLSSSLPQLSLFLFRANKCKSNIIIYITWIDESTSEHILMITNNNQYHI